MPLVKIVNHGPYALELRGQRPGFQPTPDADGKPREWPMHTIPLEKGAHPVDAEALGVILEYNESAAAIFEKQCTVEDDAPEGGSAAYVSGSRVGDLSKLTIAGAQAAILECVEPAQLETWLLQDARAPVKKALHLRHIALCPPDDDKATAV